MARRTWPSLHKAAVVYFIDVGRKEDLQRMHAKIDRLSERLPAQNVRDSNGQWYNKPLFLVLFTLLGSGLIAYFVAHWQLDQAKEETNLHQTIENQVNSSLRPILADISNLKANMAYLKAKVEDATSRKISGFSKLPTNEISTKLVDVSTTVARARAKGLISPPQTVVQLRNKLAQVQTRTPEFWVAASNLISYQSTIAEKVDLFPDAAKIRQKPCEAIHVAPGARAAGTFSGRDNGCTQQLDIGPGVVWKDFTFENAIIIYKGGPLNLENVTFKNCLFFVEFSENVPHQAKQLVTALLASSGLTFSLSMS